MKGFSLDGRGDVVVSGGDIKLAYDAELLSQKIRQVLSTNKGEWWLNSKEGIPVQKLLKKNPNLAMVKDYIRSAIAQVDSSLQMTTCDMETIGRNLKIVFEVSGTGGSAQIETEV